MLRPVGVKEKARPARRRRGAGSIYQRADGVWAASVSLGTYGGRRDRLVLYGADRDEVEAKLYRAQLQMGTGGVLPSRVPLGDFLAAWADGREAAGSLSRSQLAHDRTNITAMPAWLRGTPMGKLTTAHVQAWLDEMTGASPRTVAARRNTLRGALNDAMRKGLLDRNAAALARPPRQRRPRRTVVTGADCRAILAALEGWRYHAAASIAIGCGLRQGELLGLAWADVADGAVTVRAGLHREDGEYVLRATKTDASMAVVPLPRFAQRALEAWDQLQAAEWRTAHPDGEPVAIEEARRAGLVFTTARGLPVNGTTLTHQYQDRLAAAGITGLVWHDLRHATADLLADAGVGQTVARDYLRHASYATTADHYTGSSRAALLAAAAALEAAVG